DRQSEPGAYSDRFRGEEGVEDALQQLLWDADSRVGDFNDGSTGCIRRRHDTNFISGTIPFGECLSGVDEQVDENLTQTSIVRFYEGDFSVILHQSTPVTH